MLLNVLRNKLPPLCSLVLQLPPTTLSLNLNCNDSPEQGTIVGLVALAVLVRRRGEECSYSLRSRNLINLIALLSAHYIVLRNKLPPPPRIVLHDTRALNLNCNDSPEQGTIVGLAVLGGLVRRRGEENSCSLRSRNLINLISHA